VVVTAGKENVIDGPRDAVIVEAVRMRNAKRKGASGRASRDPSRVLRELVFRTDIEPAGMDDCIVGCVSQVGIRPRISPGAPG
jgi:acetyl-CoA acetyltransferase